MDDEDERAFVSSVLSAATYYELKNYADEIAALVRETLAPLPVLPLDPIAREQVLAGALLQAKDLARRLLAVVERGI